MEESEKDKIEKLKSEIYEYTPEAEKYKSCMLEIVSRALLIQELGNKQSSMSQNRMLEFLSLQLRMIIEYLILGCLVANSRHYKKGIEQLGKEWRPKQIKKFLENVNPKYYPNPIELEIIGHQQVNIINIKSGFITIDELINAYNICCDYLHANNPFASPKDYNVLISYFRTWLHGINGLLKQHIIELGSGRKMFAVQVIFEKDQDVHFIFLNG